MLTKKIKTRLFFLLSVIFITLLFLAFIYFSLKQNILYFKTPSEILIDDEIKRNSKIRVGGMVKKDSIQQNNKEIKFILTDYKRELIVVYNGAVPNLFSEERGAVVEGKLNDKSYLIADRILAKHDENYMPPEMKKILKMLSNTGNILLIGSIVSTFLIIYFAYQSKERSFQIKKNIIYLSFFQITFVISSFLLLIFAFIFSDFSLLAVYQNSHTAKTLFYKISGVWGNHEGSMLLWINIMVFFSYLFFVFNNKINSSLSLYTLVVQNILILGFLIFLITDSNPFFKILPIPIEGLGLNPILQDPALAIHPPLLYLGFVGSSIYFSAAVAAILSNCNGKNFALSIKKWVLISWSFQSLGIIVGSIWAYYELGWGGFWFWDPVENASLYLGFV